jgi:hypothetical protein
MVKICSRWHELLPNQSKSHAVLFSSCFLTSLQWTMCNVLHHVCIFQLWNSYTHSYKIRTQKPQLPTLLRNLVYWQFGNNRLNIHSTYSLSACSYITICAEHSIKKPPNIHFMCLHFIVVPNLPAQRQLKLLQITVTHLSLLGERANYRWPQAEISAVSPTFLWSKWWTP